MNQRLCIGIQKLDLRWEALLNDLGVWFEELDHSWELHSQYSLIVLNEKPENDRIPLLKNYLNQGGALLEMKGIMEKLSATDLPIVLSPVFYSNRSAGFIQRVLKIKKLLKPLSKGIKSDFSIQADLCRKIDAFFTNTTDETRLIQKGVSIPEEKITVIPNGVEPRFINAEPDVFLNEYGLNDFVLFADQASAERKNLIKLLETADKIDVSVVIIGSFFSNEYDKKCLRKTSESNNVTLIETLNHDSELLAFTYTTSKVFVLPSQFETPGIAAIEPALASSQIVITKKGGTREYFGEYAEYIAPDSSMYLLQGIHKAMAKKVYADLKNHFLQNYSWDTITAKTV